MNDFQSELERVMKLSERVGMSRHPVIIKQLDIALRAGNISLLKEIENKILLPELERQKAGVSKKSPFEPVFQKECGISPIPLGKVINPSWVSEKVIWGVYFLQLTYMLLCLGVWGSGKSTFNRLLVSGIVKNSDSIRITILDAKSDYHHLLNITKDVVVYDRDNYSENIFDPGDVDYSFWESYVVPAVLEVVGLAQGGETLLKDAFHQLRKLGRAINLGTVTEFIENSSYKYNDPRAKYAGSFLARAKALLAATGDMFVVGKPKVHSDKRLEIFRIHNLPADARGLLARVRMLREFVSRMSENRKTHRLEKAFVIDEGKLLFGQKSTITHLDTSILTQHLSMSREFGVGHIISDHGGDLNNIIYNAGIFIVFRAEGGVMADIGRRLRMSSEQIDYNLKLQPGQAIVFSTQLGRPFVVELFNSDFLKTPEVTEEMIERFRPPQIVKKTEILEPMLDFSIKSSHQPTIIKETPNPKTVQTSLPHSKSPFIHPLCEKLLKSLRDHPVVIVTYLFTLAGIYSRKAGSNALDELDRLKYVVRSRHKIRLGRGGTAVFVEPTKKGFAHLGIDKSRPCPRAYHRWLQLRTRDHYRAKGWSAECEVKGADVLTITPKGEKKAFEITLSLGNLQENLSRNHKSGFTTTFLFENKTILTKGRKELRGAEASLETVDPYLLKDGENFPGESR